MWSRVCPPHLKNFKHNNVSLCFSGWCLPKPTDTKTTVSSDSFDQIRSDFRPPSHMEVILKYRYEQEERWQSTEPVCVHLLFKDCLLHPHTDQDFKCQLLNDAANSSPASEPVVRQTVRRYTENFWGEPWVSIKYLFLTENDLRPLKQTLCSVTALQLPPHEGEMESVILEGRRC